MFKNIIYVVVIAIGIQFIPYGKNHINPTSAVEIKWDSQHTKDLFTKACADCHSYNTVWPEYANYAPISWLITSDIQEGREHFNISTGVSSRDISEVIESIEEGEMPMYIYTILHTEAKLTSTEKQDLISGLKKTFK